MIDGLATHSKINSNTKEMGSCITAKRSYKPNGPLSYDRFESTTRQAIIMNSLLLEHEDPIIPLSPSTSLIEEQLLIGNVLQHKDPVDVLSPSTTLDNEELLIVNVLKEILNLNEFVNMTDFSNIT